MQRVKLLILGYGRLGGAFYRLFHNRYEICGIKRSPLPDEPCPLVLMPIQSESLLPHLQWSDVVLFCPSSGGGDLDQYRETYLGNLRFVIEMIQKERVPIRGLILAGSTGVYPRSHGETWKEDDPTPIESPRQEVLLKTERALIESGVPYLILRCGGLYGEKRGLLSRVLQEGKIRTSEMSDQSIPLVHEEDVSGVIDLAIRQGKFGETFNVVDDSNLRRFELYRWIAEKAGLSMIQDGPPPALPSRAILNRKLKTVLGYRFRYPRVTDFWEDRIKVL